MGVGRRTPSNGSMEVALRQSVGGGATAGQVETESQILVCIVNELITLVLHHTFASVFLLTLAARIGVPVPAAPLLVVAGGLAHMGRISATEPLLSAVVANVLGDAIWFLAGRYWGHQVMRLLCRISLSPDSCARQAETLVNRWGGGSLIAAKFVPGISVVAAPMAGALHMPVVRFLVFETIAGVIWTVVLMGIGATFSSQIRAILDFVVVGSGAAALGTLVLGLGTYVAWRQARRRRLLRELGIPRMAIEELDDLITSGAAPFVIDVRSEPGRQSEPRQIPGATWMPLEALPTSAAGVPLDRDIVLYCNCPNEVTAARAAHLLATKGFVRARPLAGGLDAWVAAGKLTEGVEPIEQPPVASEYAMHS